MLNSAPFDYLMQLLVSESADLSDPMSVATLTVERSTAFVGEVTVYWEVENSGLDDIEPASGNLTFADVSFSTTVLLFILCNIRLSIFRPITSFFKD